MKKRKAQRSYLSAAGTRLRTWYFVLKGPPATGAGASTWAGDDANERAPDGQAVSAMAQEEEADGGEGRIPMEKARGLKMEVARRNIPAIALLNVTRNL